MDKELFGDLVTSLKQAIEISKDKAQASRRKHRRRLAERIREERELLRMIGPRHFKKRRGGLPVISVRAREKRATIRRKLPRLPKFA